MSRFPIPDAALAQHTAVLGKTGSGKTSTAKLIIEHLVAQGARICILDPIKSDWWGLTSSVDGKRAGLPFHILGGPRGHVPLYAFSGKAIAEIVANGTLPLSIIDMADFAPGGQSKFFIDFAPTLLRRMRGVVHLVMEEAHLFAPKERSGVGDENMAIHWAKMLATAGRSKGIRLILVTQRTQALHNAMLGSCETMVAHRLTAPADQKPLIDWLKANTAKDVVERVSGSLASLKTGTAWVCSGEAKFFELVQFPRIKTYDNSATPTGIMDLADVRTAPVDIEKLRAIVGDAAKEAEANDPKALKAEIVRLTADLRKPTAAVQADSGAVEQAEHRGYKRGKIEGYAAAISEIAQQHGALVEDVRTAVKALGIVHKNADTIQRWAMRAVPAQAEPSWPAPPQIAATPPRTPAPIADGKVGPSARKILDVVHSHFPASLSFAAAAMRAGISKRSSAYRSYRSEVLGSGEVIGDEARLRSADGFASPVRMDGDPVDTWASRLPPSYGNMLRTIAKHGHGADRETIATQAGISPTSSGLGSGLRELIDLKLIQKDGNTYRLAEALRQ